MDEGTQRETSSVVEEICKDHSVRRYQKGKFLGKVFNRKLSQGGFAKCYEISLLDTRKIMAAKVIPKASLSKHRAKQKLMSEIKIHKSIHHTNVVGFEHFFEDNENVYILLELCHNQTMNELLRRRKRLTELEVQCYLLQILSALRYLHKNRVIHRDLKLGNLFLSQNMEIKLGDFGLATKVDFEGERKRTICGTPNYIAPEILEGKSGHSYEVDIWSFGVIAYTLLIGKPPFETNDVKTTYRRIKMNAYSFPEHVIISHNSKYSINTSKRNLIQRILQTEPQKRPSLDEILSHEFFQAKVPKLMPVSTLACPPSSAFLRQYQQVSQSPGMRDQENQTVQRQRQKQNNLAASVQHLMNKPLDGILNTSTTRSPALKQPLFKSVERLTIKPSTAPFDNPLNQNYFQESLLKEPSVWVQKWVDYSSKYGLGYLLQTGQVGVFFNDCSKLLLMKDSEDFLYYDRNGQEQTATITTFPISLQKKVTLLHHFKNYLLDNSKVGSISNTERAGGGNANQIYVKKWVKSKHAIMFRFSDKTVQVVFTDSTQVILTQQLRVVTYLNKLQEKSTMLLSHALESECNEMVKRLKYTKEILSQMLQGPGDQQAKEKYQRDSRDSQERITKYNTMGEVKSVQAIPTQPLQEKLNTINDQQPQHNLGLGNFAFSGQKSSYLKNYSGNIYSSTSTLQHSKEKVKTMKSSSTLQRMSSVQMK